MQHLIIIRKSYSSWMEWSKVHSSYYEDVKCIKLPINRFFPYMFVYAYIVDGLLIDTGPGHSKAQFGRILQEAHVEKVAITHEHKDHCGMAKWINKHFDVPIYMNKVKRGRWSLNEAFVVGQVKNIVKQYPEKIELKQHTIQPIYTPGHTSDHTCLYEPNKGWLFTGDLYVTPEPKVSFWSESISKHIESLRSVITLDFETVFCAHQGIIKNGKQKVTEKLNYLENLQLQVVRLYESGYNERGITKKLFPEKARLERLTFGAFSSLHLVRQIIRSHNKHV